MELINECQRCQQPFAQQWKGKGGRKRFCPECQTAQKADSKKAFLNRQQTVEIDFMANLMKSLEVHTRTETAAKLGCTPSAVRQVEQSIYSKLWKVIGPIADELGFEDFRKQQTKTTTYEQSGTNAPVLARRGSGTP